MSKTARKRIEEPLFEAGRIIGFIGFIFSFGAITWNINRNFTFAFPIIWIELIALLGLIFSWHRKLFVTSVLLLLSSIGQAIRTYYTHQLLGWLDDVLLFLVASILFFVLWWLTRKSTDGEGGYAYTKITIPGEWMRKTGRIFGFVGLSLSIHSVVAFFLSGLTLFDIAFISLFSATLIALAGLIVSWRRAAIASPLLFVSSIGLVVCAYDSRQISELWTWISFLLYLIPGILFFRSWKLFKEATTRGMAITN